MRLKFIALQALALAFAISSPAWTQSQHQPDRSPVEDLSWPNGKEPPLLGIHWARGFNPNSNASINGAGSDYPLMDYHGGKIMTTANITAIFWGKGWATYTGDEFVGMDDWYTGFSNSYYAAASDEYTQAGGQAVGPSISYAGRLVDTSRASGGNRSGTILAEVCKEIGSKIDKTGNGYYPVYVDLPRSGSYCAWHSWGSCNGYPVQFAFFWKLDGDAGCDPLSTVANQSEGLQALANVSGHELSETRTDPQGTGWYDSTGAENGDKCAWTFEEPYVTFTDLSAVNFNTWKIQGEWSNAWYGAGTGYPNSSGQLGCLQGDGTD